ncbi:MAG: hemolysin family protein [Snowella sp.]|nr:hemolysin family protein [Snowella sp.]
MDSLLWQLLLVFLLIAINAFFVTAEFSIVTVRRSRINQLAEAGDIPAQRVKSLKRRLDKLLATTQLGISLAVLSLGWLGTKTIYEITQSLLAAFSFNPLDYDWIAHGVALPTTFILIAYLQIVLGELVPKSLAFLYAEQLSRKLTPIINAIAKILHPLIWLLDQSTKTLLGLGGVKMERNNWHERVTSEELQLMISTDVESTGLDHSERTILNNIFEFGDVTAAEIMIPRHQVATLSESATFTDLLEAINLHKHSRYPIKGESLDDILGIIDFKELAIPLSRGQLSSDTPLKPWIKPIRFVPESAALSDLLTMMQRSQLKTVMVVDEFGGTCGLITLEDLVEEILGDSAPEENDDNDEATILEMIDADTFLVEAQINVEELNEVLNLNLPLLDDYQTLGGFLLYEWQKIPTQGESLTYKNLTFTLETVQGPKLEIIRIHRSLPAPSQSQHSMEETIELTPVL